MNPIGVLHNEELHKSGLKEKSQVEIKL